jgi:hypothetical protein
MKKYSPPIDTLVSGGQTGVDRAALDAALELGIPCGGWCPKGRWSESGVIAPAYPLRETPSEEVAQRTEWNARDSDGTLVIAKGSPVGGTALTVDMAARYRKPCLIVDVLDSPENIRDSVRTWIGQNRIRALNVAGPRESTTPGIYETARALLRTVLR